MLIAFGSAVGGVFRFMIYQLIDFINKTYWQNNLKLIYLLKIPVATILVNIIGSLIAGILYLIMIKNFNNFSPILKNFLMAGVLAGFTTFSTFSLDCLRLIESTQYGYALIYILTSVFGSIFAVFLGFYLAKIILFN